MYQDHSSFPQTGAREVPDLSVREQLEFEVSQLIDGTLAADRRAVVQAALARDGELRALHDSLRQVDDLLGREPELGQFDLGLMTDQIMEAVHAEEAGAPVVLKLPAASVRRAWWVTISAAAAALILGLGIGLLTVNTRQDPSLLVERGELLPGGMSPAVALVQPELSIAGPGSILQEQRASVGSDLIAMSVTGPDLQAAFNPDEEAGLPEYYAIYTGAAVMDAPSQTVIASAVPTLTE